MHRAAGRHFLHLVAAGHRFYIVTATAGIGQHVIVRAGQFSPGDAGQCIVKIGLGQNFAHHKRPGHPHLPVAAEQVVNAHGNPGLVHADHPHAANNRQRQKAQPAGRLAVQQNHKRRRRGVHVPGLAKKAPAIGGSSGADHKRGAVVRAGIGRNSRADGFIVVNRVDEIGEAVEDDQLGQAHACGRTEAGQLVHQLRGVGAVMGQAGVTESQHLGPRQLVAGPVFVAAEHHALFGQFFDVVAIGQPVLPAHFKRRAG